VVIAWLLEEDYVRERRCGRGLQAPYWMWLVYMYDGAVVSQLLVAVVCAWASACV